MPVQNVQLRPQAHSRIPLWIRLSAAALVVGLVAVAWRTVPGLSLLWRRRPSTADRPRDSVGRPELAQAVIVEMLPQPAMEAAVSSVCNALGVGVTIVHGTSNEAEARQVAQAHPGCVIRRLRLNAGNINHRMYSRMLLSQEFWGHMGQSNETILLFQSDSGVCGKTQEGFVARMTQYDYCGAPWEGTPLRVGNGGFSVRSVGAARWLLQLHGEEHDSHEDVAFSTMCSSTEGCTLCPPQVAFDFATETVANPSAWAFHKNWLPDGWRGPGPLCELNQEVRDMVLDFDRAPWAAFIPQDPAWQPVLSAMR